MYELTSDRLAGPLSQLREQPFGIDGFMDLNSTRIGLIGDTYAGKTQIVKALTHTLGGVYQERHLRDRTLDDSSYIFGEYNSEGQRKTFAVGLKTHAGHKILYGKQGPKAKKNIIVLKYMKSSTFNKQFELIEPIIETEGITYEECLAILTRITSTEQMTTRRRNMVLRQGFRNIYFADNPKQKKYPLAKLDESNINAVLELLRDDLPDIKLIYFGSDQIPSSLEDKLVKFDNHLTFSDWEPVDDPEDRTARAVFGDDYDAVLF